MKTYEIPEIQLIEVGDILTNSGPCQWDTPIG